MQWATERTQPWLRAQTLEPDCLGSGPGSALTSSVPQSLGNFARASVS